MKILINYLFRFCLITFSLLPATEGLSQAASHYSELKNSPLPYSENAIYFSVLEIISPNLSALSFGWSRRGEYYGLNASIGIPFRALKLVNLNSDKYEHAYFKAKLEGRQFFSIGKPPYTRKRQAYIGVLYSFDTQSFLRVNDDLFTKSGDKFSYQFAVVSAFTQKIGLSTGTQFKFGNRFYLELGIATGLRIRNTRHESILGLTSSNTTFIEDQTPKFITNLLGKDLKIAGVGKGMFFQINLNVAYRIGRIYNQK